MKASETSQLGVLKLMYELSAAAAIRTKERRLWFGVMCPPEHVWLG
jgi:hypothetical protein